MCYLSSIQGFVSRIIVVEKTHIDEGDQKTGSIFRCHCIVSRPLVEDEQDQITKQTAHEHNLRNETQENVQRFLEIPVRHMKKSIVRTIHERTIPCPSFIHYLLHMHTFEHTLTGD